MRLSPRDCRAAENDPTGSYSRASLRSIKAHSSLDNRHPTAGRMNAGQGFYESRPRGCQQETRLGCNEGFQAESLPDQVR